jgi:hypothetical protein
VEEGVGGWVIQEEGWVHNLGAELLVIDLRWTPALGDGSHRSFGVIPELAAVAQLQ